MPLCWEHWGFWRALAIWDHLGGAKAGCGGKPRCPGGAVPPHSNHSNPGIFSGPCGGGPSMGFPGAMNHWGRSRSRTSGFKENKVGRRRGTAVSKMPAKKASSAGDLPKIRMS